MAFAQGKFGIEYNTARTDDDSSSLLPWALGVVFLLAIISLAITLTARAKRKASDEMLMPAEVVAEIAAGAEGAQATAAGETGEAPSGAADAGQAAAAAPEPEIPPPEEIKVSGTARRPAKVTNLLMRLETAEKNRDMAMAIETIEQLRSLPGNPAADLDDSLARRLGVLNMRRLFAPGKSPWTTEIVVKRGENASRIAYEHGSTLASLAKLNGGNVDKVVIGKKLRVMDHPRFSLVIHRLSKTADLSLNGKFFKRYYLKSDVKGAIGAYEVPDRLRPFWKEQGIALEHEDRAELEMLLPKGATILIADF